MFAAAKSWVSTVVGKAMLYQPCHPVILSRVSYSSQLGPLKNSTRTVEQTIVAKGPNKDVLL